MDVGSFEEIAEEFEKRYRRIVWCTVATVDAKGRPRSRILHPIWEGTTGYIATGRDSFKAKHLAKHPYVSLSYWDPQQEQIYADCLAEWDDAIETKRKVWEMFKNAPPQLGYDPAMIWRGGPEDPGFGVMKLTPWRIELYRIADLATGTQSKVWRPA